MNPQMLSEEMIEHIADVAAQKAVEQMTANAYKAVGKSVLDKMFYMVGLLTVGLYLWAQNRGWFK